jgi:hypothetical protein
MKAILKNVKVTSLAEARLIVGRTPRSAADAPVGFGLISAGRGRPARTWRPPHNKSRVRISSR